MRRVSWIVLFTSSAYTNIQTTVAPKVERTRRAFTHSKITVLPEILTTTRFGEHYSSDHNQRCSLCGTTAFAYLFGVAKYSYPYTFQRSSNQKRWVQSSVCESLRCIERCEIVITFRKYFRERNILQRRQHRTMHGEPVLRLGVRQTNQKHTHANTANKRKTNGKWENRFAFILLLLDAFDSLRCTWSLNVDKLYKIHRRLISRLAEYNQPTSVHNLARRLFAAHLSQIVFGWIVAELRTLHANSLACFWIELRYSNCLPQRNCKMVRRVTVFFFIRLIWICVIAESFVCKSYAHFNFGSIEYCG